MGVAQRHARRADESPLASAPVAVRLQGGAIEELSRMNEGEGAY